LNNGFECNPELNAIEYKDEVLQGGRVYQNQKGIRNEKTLIRLNEIWMQYEDCCSTPYWNSYVIVEKDIDKDRLKGIIKNLYNTNKMILNNSKEAFLYRVDNMDFCRRSSAARAPGGPNVKTETEPFGGKKL
jgi:hypothetical protein